VVVTFLAAGRRRQDAHARLLACSLPFNAATTRTGAFLGPYQFYLPADRDALCVFLCGTGDMDVHYQHLRNHLHSFLNIDWTRHGVTTPLPVALTGVRNASNILSRCAAPAPASLVPFPLAAADLAPVPMSIPYRTVGPTVRAQAHGLPAHLAVPGPTYKHPTHHTAPNLGSPTPPAPLPAHPPLPLAT